MTLASIILIIMIVSFVLILIASVVAKPVIQGNQEGFKPVTATSQEYILADVQDRLDSLDQAGLYVLLQRLSESPSPTSQPVETVDPRQLMAHPTHYRGRILRYPALIYRRTKALNVAHILPFDPDKLCYIVAKIPYGKDLAYPAIVILTQAPQPPVDRATIQGYFYMILRSETQKPPGGEGPAVLDFLVFVSNRLLPVTDDSSIKPPQGRTSLYWSGSGLTVLAMLWIWLRWRLRCKVRSKPAGFRKRF